MSKPSALLDRAGARGGTVLLALSCLTACGSSGAASQGRSGAEAGSSAAGIGPVSAGGAPAAGGVSGGGTSAASGGMAAGAPSGGATGAAGMGGASGVSGGTGGVSGGASGSGGALSAGAGTPSAGGAPAGAATFDVKVELASDVQPTAPGTVGIVTFTVTGASLTSASIEFGLDTQYGTKAPVDLSVSDHRTLLLGMKPTHTYHFRVVGSDGTASFTSDDYTVTTGPATTLVTLSDFSVLDESARERGFVILSERQGSNVAFVIDADGEIVWWYQSTLDGIARARMSEDGKSMWLVKSGNDPQPLVRVSMDTLTVQSFAMTAATHDIAPIGGASMAYLDYGEGDCTSIFEIDDSGMTSEIFESQGIVDTAGCHGNSLRYSKKEDVFTYSDLNQDVFALDRSGKVLWRLADLVSGGNATWGGAQHGQQLLDDSLLVFANLGAGSSASAVIEYGLDGTELRRFPSGGYSSNLGDVQRLPGGNTLITYSTDGLAQEVDDAGNAVLEFAVSGSLAYSLWLPSLYEPVPDTLL